MTTEPAGHDHHVMLDEVRVHYRECGAPDAPAVVILHGITGAAWMFDHIAGALADRLHVTVPDLRGHGESDWRRPYTAATFGHDLEQLAVQLRLFRFALVGQSLGGTTAYHYAARYPERVERLVISDIGPDSFSTVLLAQVIAQITARAEDVFDNPEEPVRQALANPSPVAPTDARVVRARTIANLVQGTDGRWRWRYDAAGLGETHPYGSEAEAAAWAALGQVRCPTLVLRGEQSPALSRENAERMVRTLADGRWVEVPASGHGIPFDNPEGFLAVVRPFLLEHAG